MTLETTTISGCPNAALPLSGAERLVMDQGGATVDASAQDVADLAEPKIADAIEAHEGAANPHPVYLTQSEGDTRYAPLGSTGGLAAYVHTQSAPAMTWAINHNLGRYPSVELFNTGMQEIDAEIAHPSVNQTVVTLKPAIAGLARLI